MKINWRIPFLAITLIFSSISTPIAVAETVINAQIIEKDLILSKNGSPYVINGLIQIPRDRNLIIEPGAVVNFLQGSGIKSQGNIRIGALNSQDRVTVNLKNGLLFGYGLIPPSIQIANTDLIGTRAALTYGCGSLTIENSYIEGFTMLVNEQECKSMTIKSSYFNQVNYLYEGFFDGHPDSFVVENNIFNGITSFCCELGNRTMGAQSDTAIFRVTNNDFRNITEINLPYGYKNFLFSKNNFYGAKIVRTFGYVPTIPNVEISQNYWGSLKDDKTIRSFLKVIDAKSDIALPSPIIFEPILNAPITISGFPASIQQKKDIERAKADAEAKAKADAEAKAKADAEAKAKADAEANANKLKADVANLFSTIKEKSDKLIKMFSSQKNEILRYSDTAILLFNNANLTDEIKIISLTKVLSDLVNFESKLSKSKQTITCVKNGKSIRVSDFKPKCPSGYKKS